MKTQLVLGLVFGLLISSSAGAAFVAPDNAVALVGGDYGGYHDVGNLIDGSGLSVHNETGVLAGTIDANDNTAFYPTILNQTGTLNFTFNAPLNISGFYLWSAVHQGSQTNRGIQDFTLEFFNGANSLGVTSLMTATQYATNQPTYGSESFSGFYFTDVTGVNLNVLSNYGDGFYYSAHEVGFDTVSAVPVPAAVWLFGSGLIGLFGLRRKKSISSAGVKGA